MQESPGSMRIPSRTPTNHAAYFILILFLSYLLWCEVPRFREYMKSLSADPIITPNPDTPSHRRDRYISLQPTTNGNASIHCSIRHGPYGYEFNDAGFLSLPNA